MKKILIIDDSMFTRNIHRSMLGALNYSTIEADSGTAGIESYKTEKPDLVIIDLLMPDMDGMEAVKQIMEFDSEAKVMICSTDRQKFRKAEAKEIGALNFLHKPLDEELLSEALSSIFD